MKIALLTGCNDKHYQLGLASGLIKNDIELDFIANDDMIDASKLPKVNYLNFRGDQDRKAPIMKKVIRILSYYGKIIKYAAASDSQVYHIQWFNRFIVFDRTLLNVFYKMMGKKIVYTAHNINERTRDGGDTFINRWSLNFLYRIVDHIIVHTEKMKQQLVDEYQVAREKITVIPHGIYDVIPQTSLTKQEARAGISLQDSDRTILFFGNIAPYKGLEFLLMALAQLKKRPGGRYKVIIAGKIKDCPEYWRQMEQIISENGLENDIIRKTEFIPDDDIEMYFKAADLLVLPYTYIFQSGILFLAFNFGLPVVATDVGSLREDIVEGKTGFICAPKDAGDLARKIEQYFASELYEKLEDNRPSIVAYANEKYSWASVGEKTYAVYGKMLAK